MPTDTHAKASAKAQLEAVNTAITGAILLLASERATLEQFFAEKARMESVGPILHPTLFNSSERRAVEALLSPVYRAALDFLNVYERQMTSARHALGKVSHAG